MDMHNGLHNKDLQYGTWPGQEGSLGENDPCVRMAESLCYWPETTTTLLINYAVVVQSLSCPTLCDPMDCSMHVLHYLLQSAHIPVH